MGLLNLFVAATIPVLKVLLVTIIGSFLAMERIDILGEDARKHLNNVVFYVFSPALVGSALAKTITFESMVKLWFMPVNILLTFIIGSALGWILVKITRAPSNLRGLIVGCCSAGNMGNLLLIFIPAVCKEKGSPFGDPDACHTFGMAYSSLSMAIGAVYLWVYVYNIVRISVSVTTKEGQENGSTVSNGEISKINPGSCTEPLLPSKGLVSKDYADQFLLPYATSEGKSKVSFVVKFKQNIEMLLRKINLKTLLAPSTIGAIVGFIVGLVPLIRGLMIGESAPLHVILDSAALLGDGAIPVLTLLVGGNLTRGLQRSGIQVSAIAGIIAVRYIFLPLMGVIIIKGALHLGLLYSDPLYLFILLIQYVVPPAMNIGTVVQLFGVGMSECSVIMLWSYAFASFALTLWSTFFMWLLV